MAELNENQIAWLRDEVGDQPADADLQVRYDRTGSVRDVAVGVLRQRRANMLASPLSTTLQGVAAVNYAENVKALDRRIAALQLLDDDPTSDPGEDSDGGAAPVEYVERYQLVRSRGR